jgi:glycosyltransferase involved in cell wall biosynthesis
VHVLTLGGNVEPEVEVSPSGSPYIFTGGYTNRDYENFFAAVETLPYRVIAVASARNRLGTVPSNVELRLDIPWGEFEELLAGAHVVVLPLLPTGEVSGGSTLIRGMRYGAPLVVTRHDGMIAHLGPEYAGYVPPGDADALRTAIDRAMSDETFRRTIIDDLQVKRAEFARLHSNPASEVLAICQPGEVAGPGVEYQSSVT